MCRYEVYKVQDGLTCQHVTGDSVTQVCLIPAQGEEAGTGKDSMLEKAALLAIKAFFSYSVAYFVSLWAMDAAYAERGYEAYGGEYILILWSFMLAYKALSLFFGNFRRKKDGEKRSGRSDGGFHTG